MKEKIGSLCVLLGMLATMLPAQTWSGDQAVALRVEDSKGRAIANARVVLTFQGVPGETGPDIVATDSNGRAVLASLAPGPWQVEISHPEYLSYIAMVDVRRGKKPVVSASFLEAGGRSLSPVKVKFSKGDRQPASPVLEARQSVVPPVAVPPVAAEREAPAPQIVEVPDAIPTPAAPAAPEPTPEVMEPVPAPAPEPETAPAVAQTEATTPEPEPTIAEPVSATVAVAEPEKKTVPQQPSKTETIAPLQPPAPVPQTEVAEVASDPTPASTAPPEPEQPAAPSPTEVEIEAAAQQVAALEPDVEEPEAPDLEPTIAETMAEDEALTVEPTPRAEEIVPEQIPEKAEPVIADVAAAEPEAEVPVPRQQPAAEPPAPITETAAEPAVPPTATTETPPPPPVAAAPAPAVTAIPPPPDPGARITSHSNGSCPDCASAEWTLEAGVAAPALDPGSAGTCGTEILEVARMAMQGLSTSIQLELDGFIGPIANGTSQEAVRRVEPDLATPFVTELADYVGGTSPCQIVGLVLPKAVRFSRVQLAASDRDGTGGCAPGQACAIGDAFWLGSVLVERGPSATVIYGLFENRSAELGRRALLTAYYRPPNANWRPRLPPVD